MSTNFPTNLDAFTNPAATDPLSSPPHHTQHDNANDAITAIETKVGVDGSAVPATIDYLLKNPASIDPGHKHTAASLVGLAGSSGMTVDGDDGLDSFVPGPMGPPGSSGSTGAQGPMGPVFTVLDGEDGLDSMIPGPAGIDAYTTTTGSTTIPVVTGLGTVVVAKLAWMAVGQTIFISDGSGGHSIFAQVSSLTPSTSTVGYQVTVIVDGTLPGDVIAPGAHVTASGLRGLTGAQGPTGPSIIVADGDDGLDSFIPGPQGASGAAGATGPQGPIGIGMDGEDGQDAMPISPLLVAAPLIILQDQKATTVAGGTFTAGADQTRVLNTKVVDTGGYCSLSSNQFTLQPGTYEIEAIAPALAVGLNQAWLFNVTDSAVVLVGTSVFSANAANGFSESKILGRFTLAAAKALSIQHRCATTVATSGFGQACSFATPNLEVYTTVVLRKVA